VPERLTPRSWTTLPLPSTSRPPDTETDSAGEVDAEVVNDLSDPLIEPAEPLQESR
jgi:hypothetical protein